MEYRITEIDAEGVRQKEVQGLPVVVRGFEFLDLFMTQADGTYGMARRGFSRNELQGKYLITERTTGLNLFGAFDGPEEAYYEVSAKLHEKGEERMRFVVDLKKQQLGNMDL